MANSGIVKTVAGNVKAISVKGTERILHTGDSVSSDERIVTGDTGTITIEFSDGTHIGLGINSNINMDETLKQVSAEKRTEETEQSEQATSNIIPGNVADEVAAIQQALVSDQAFDPSTLAAPAAGVPAVAGGENGGHSIVGIDYLNPTRTPNSGFNTLGIAEGDPLSFDLTETELILEPGTVIIISALDRLTDGNDFQTINEDSVATGDVLLNAVNFDGSSSVTSFTVNDQTANAGDTITVEGVGALTIAATGAYTFTPIANYNGTVPAATYTVVDDSDPTDTVTSTLNITVTPVADSISDANETQTINEDEATTGNVLANTTNVDGSSSVSSFTVGEQTVNAGETLTIDGVGMLTIAANGAYSFTPIENYNGTVPTASYTVVNDSNPADTVISTLNITVAPVADSITDENETQTINEGETATGNVLTNTTNVDGTSSVTSFTVAGQTVNAGETATIANVGALTIATNGEYTFTPVANYSGTVPTVSYTVADDTDATDTVTSTLDITVTPANTPAPPTIQITDHNGSELGDNRIVEDSSTAVTGTFVLVTPEGLSSITVAGQLISEADLLATGTSPINMTGTEGTLTIDGFDASSGTVNYSYVPESGAKDHSAGDENIVDQIQITVTDDSDVTSEPGVLDVLIVDTEPQAIDNFERLSQDNQILIDNVITNTRASGDTALDDSLGVDGAKMHSVTYAGVTKEFLEPLDLVQVDGSDFIQFNTVNGTLLIREDGLYGYTDKDASVTIEVTDIFTYQLIDGDGDLSAANLSITQVLGENINTGEELF